MVTLSPDEALQIADRLTQITMDFLHDNVWGARTRASSRAKRLALTCFCHTDH